MLVGSVLDGDHMRVLFAQRGLLDLQNKLLCCRSIVEAIDEGARRATSQYGGYLLLDHPPGYGMSGGGLTGSDYCEEEHEGQDDAANSYQCDEYPILHVHSVYASERLLLPRSGDPPVHSPIIYTS